MKSKKGHQGHASKDGDHKSEEAKDFSLLFLWCIDDEDQHIDGFNCWASSIDCWHQNIVLGHERQSIPATKYKN